MAIERNRCLNHFLAEHASLRRRLLRQIRIAADVDDFMQEIFLRIVRASFPSDKPVASLSGYVWTIAKSVAADWARAEERRAKAHAFLGVLEDPINYGRLDTALQTRVELEALYKAYRSLPRRQRQVIRLRKVRGFSQREIATQLGISENTVETYIGAAMENIERQLMTMLDAEEQKTVLAWLRRRTSHD